MSLRFTFPTSLSETLAADGERREIKRRLDQLQRD
jgi:hypothetical protein